MHPDTSAENVARGKWITSKRTKATAISTVLLIPCHDEAGNHWFLLARIKMPGGKHNVYIFDSMGIALARSRMKKVKKLLMAIHLMEKTDKCCPMDVRRQTEQECGVRMMDYMLMIRECVDRNKEGTTIIRQMCRNTKVEKKSTHDLAQGSRRKISNFLKTRRENAVE